MGERLNVFISSTARDLQKYRAKVKEAVLRAGAFPVAMEEFDATTRNALQLCYDEVMNADVLVGIYAHRYGFAPDSSMTFTTTDGEIRSGDGQTGITHWEYRWAIKSRIPVLLYVISNTDENGDPMTWPVSFIDDEPEKSRLKDFKGLIMGKHGVNFFTSPDDLAGKVGVAVAKLVATVPATPTLAEKSKETSKTRDKPLSDKTRQTNRTNMLELVEQVWITGYLDNVLTQNQSLKIPLGFTEPDKVVQQPGLADYALPDSSEIVRAFHDLNERLVILGEPGSGKTVALVQLCRALIGEARADEKKPIPVVLSLTSWAAEQPPFETWLRKELVDKYALPRKAADDFVLGEQFLYLLDGLDEVAEAQRENCLKAIKTFAERERPLTQYAICSRRAEFMALETRLDVAGELVLQALTAAQIDQYLDDAAFTGLRTVMNGNAILQDFAHVPFMLNTMAVVARDIPERKLRLMLADQDNPDALRDVFLEQYVQRRLQENPSLRYPDLHKTRHYLQWLAGQLVSHDQTDFYIEDMQPDWLGSDAHQRRYRRRLCLVIGLGGGLGGELAFGLTLGLLGGLPFRMAFGLAGVLAGVLVVVLLFDLPLRHIIMTNQIGWSSSRSKLANGLANGLQWMLVWMLMFGLAFGLEFGLLFGLLGGLSVGLSASFDRIEAIALRLHPNIGMRRSFTNFLSALVINVLGVGSMFVLGFGLAFGLELGLPGGLVFGLVFGLAVMLAIGLTGVINDGGGAVLGHIILRYYLARDGHIPHGRYDKFLDYAHDLVILRKVGGGYRFVHDYLRQYLASAR